MRYNCRRYVSFRGFFLIFFKIVLVLVPICLFVSCDILNEPKRLLAEYEIGSSLSSINLEDKCIHFQLKLDEKVGNINVFVGGYERPERTILKNQRLIMIGEGEYIVYLYFDENDILYDKEIVGS